MQNRFLWLGIGFLLLSTFFGLQTPLWDQDESAYMGFSSNMIQSGNWVLPDYPLSEPHRKTPMHFWVSSLSFLIFGESIVAHRIPNLLYFWGSAVLVSFIYRKFYKDSLGRDSVLALGIFLSGIFLAIYSKIALTDIGLLFWELFALYFLIKILEVDKFRESIGSILFFWFGIGMGMLQKGPPILILLGGISIFFLIFSPSRTRIFRLHPWIFLPLSAVPLFIWGEKAWEQTDGEFIRWLIDWYILKRTGGSVFGQSGPPGTYLILFILFLFPWSFYFLSIFQKIYKEFRSAQSFQSSENLLIPKNEILYIIYGWILFGWIFYEILPSKLPSYTLSVYPLLSILTARIISLELPKDSEKPIIGKIFAIFLAMAWGGLLFYILEPNLSPFLKAEGFFEFRDSIQNPLALFGIYVLSFVLGFFLIFGTICYLKSSNKTWVYLTFPALGLFHLILSVFYLPLLGEYRNYPDLIQKKLIRPQWTKLQNKLSGTQIGAESGISLRESQSTNLEEPKLIIDTRIRLASLVYSAKQLGIPTSQILTLSQETSDLRNYYRSSKSDLFLLTKDSLLEWMFLGETPRFQCLEIYSYESGKKLEICSLVSGERQKESENGNR